MPTPAASPSGHKQPRTIAASVPAGRRLQVSPATASLVSRFAISAIGDAAGHRRLTSALLSTKAGAGACKMLANAGFEFALDSISAAYPWD